MCVHMSQCVQVCACVSSILFLAAQMLLRAKLEKIKCLIVILLVFFFFAFFSSWFKDNKNNQKLNKNKTKKEKKTQKTCWLNSDSVSFKAMGACVCVCVCVCV